MTVNGFWSIPQQGYVDRPVGAEVERTEVEQLLHQRYVREEASRIDVDAERLKSDIDDRLGPAPREPVETVTPIEANGVTTQEAPPTEAIPLHYGPDGEPPGPKYADLTPEQRKKEAERRIALDETEEEKPKFKHPCPFCELGYQHSSSLNKHVKQKHGGDDANSRSANINNDSEIGVNEGTASTEGQ
jgi:hypothetical protein